MTKAIIGFTMVLILPLQSVRAASPEEEAGFLAAAKLAFEKHDADALAALTCWDGVPDKIKDLCMKHYASSVAAVVTDVALASPDQKTHPMPPAADWKDDFGVVYRPNLPVTNHLNVTYAPGTTIESKIGKAKVKEAVLPVGEKDGKLYLTQPAPAMIQPVPAKAPSTGGADKIEPTTGKDTATAYFEALMKGDAEGINALVAAPFSFDRKQVLQTKEEVEKTHREVVQNKSKRKVPEYTLSIPAKAPELDRDIFPDYGVFRITISGDNEHIDIYVTKDASPKVIGFSD